MEQRLNSGAIFKNTKKEKETQPDYNGAIDVNGKEFRIALWVKDSKAGNKFFSVAISEPQVHTASLDPVKDEDDLPF
jgi:uncharacterized protein (DUF736 family)